MAYFSSSKPISRSLIVVFGTRALLLLRVESIGQIDVGDEMIGEHDVQNGIPVGSIEFSRSRAVAIVSGMNQIRGGTGPANR